MQHIHIQKLDKPKPKPKPKHTPINAFVNTLLIEDLMSNIIYGNYDFININKSIQENTYNIHTKFVKNLTI